MVVGLDGVPYSLLRKFIEAGVAPQMKRIFSGGELRRMEVVFPEISSVSWPSFMSGKDPGGHGIFGFTELRPNSYELFFPQFTDLKAPTIWDRLAEKGKRSIVINQPSTYPARKIEGALISGFVAVDIFKSVYPTKYLGALKRMNYEVDIDTARARKNADFLFTSLDRALKARAEALDLLRQSEEWDYLEVVITGTDRLQHYQMHSILDPAAENHQRAIDYYRKVDDFVGKAFDDFCAAGGDAENFMMLSDHGFTGIASEVYLNAWLKESGYLVWEGEGKKLGDISPEAKAFALDPGRIFIHRAGRFPKGKVKPEQAPKIAAEIAAGLKELKHEGKPVVREVWTPEKIYHGPYTSEAADLIVWSNDGYDLKGSLEPGAVFRTTDLTGMHTQHDAFLYSSGKFHDGVHITQLADYIISKF